MNHMVRKINRGKARKEERIRANARRGIGRNGKRLGLLQRARQDTDTPSSTVAPEEVL